MANLTIVVDPEILKQARIQAMQDGTTVNKLLAAHLDDYVGRRTRQGHVLNRILELAEKTGFSSGGRNWTRDELHERR